MNPSSNNPGMELPPPLPESGQLPSTSESESKKPQSELQPAPNFEKAGNSNAAQAAPLSIPLPITPKVPQSTSQTDDSNTTNPASLQIADEKDLIEKEWVNKAKAIVERTRNDPYKQSEDLTLLKADYMKKQFNKTIKVNK